MEDDGSMEQESGGPSWAVPGSLAEPAAALAPLDPAPGAPGGPGGTGGPGGPGQAGNGAAGRSAPVGSVAATGPLGETTAAVPELALHPMTVADILDGSFSIVKARPARILGITALFVVPVHLLAAFLQRNTLGGTGVFDLLNSDDPAVVAEANRTNGAEVVGAILVWVVPALALTFVAAALARLVGAWSAGHDLDAGELLRTVGRKWWTLLAAFAVVHVAEAVSLLGCYVGLVFVMPLFAVTAPVIGAEGLGPMRAVRRSANLASRRYWPVLGIAWLIGITASLLSYALGGLPQLLTAWFGYDVAWPLLAAGNILGAIIATPFVAAATVLLYLDLRIRTEGLDIEMSARELLDGPA
ncbi:MAG TPA: hypothetical protein VGO78_06775 [Acidimicrobiales bacterium]|jgi:hypothetical protein|nr:hypothetical protein [Acidimicrobiales bacterium]